MKAFATLDQLLVAASVYATRRGPGISTSWPPQKSSNRVGLLCRFGRRSSPQRKKRHRTWRWKAIASHSQRHNKWCGDGCHHIEHAKQTPIDERTAQRRGERKTIGSFASPNPTPVFTVCEEDQASGRSIKCMICVFSKNVPFNALGMEPHLAQCKVFERAQEIEGARYHSERCTRSFGRRDSK